MISITLTIEDNITEETKIKIYNYLKNNYSKEELTQLIEENRILEVLYNHVNDVDLRMFKATDIEYFTKKFIDEQKYDTALRCIFVLKAAQEENNLKDLYVLVEGLCVIPQKVVNEIATKIINEE